MRETRIGTMKRLSLLLFLFMLTRSIPDALAQHDLAREFRGVWVATVGNIDWPSRNDLSTEDQKNEVYYLLDLFKSMNFNAVIFQIRPSADAFYNSRHEPWSSYLTGTSDLAPAPYYDPLAFLIDETHKRGMEFHAWLNPYRAMVKYREYHANPFRLTYEKPEWFVNYGENKYFNPGIPEVRQYTAGIVADIVQNYDIDAIHFDDYFYPYRIDGEEFDDAAAFQNFGGSFLPEGLEDWRRNNVNLIISELRQTIKLIKPWVQLGISPFGVWRNKDRDARGSETRAGQTNYDDLYADILHWVQSGWVDYILPQAYWHLGHKEVDYGEVVRWWSENSYGTNLFIGHALYRLDQKKEHKAWRRDKPNEIERQLDLNRTIPGVQGSVFFSAKSLLENPFKIDELLRERYFSIPALPPRVNHLLKKVPEPVYNVRLDKMKGKQYRLLWDSHPENKEKEAVRFVVYQFNEGETKDLSDNSRIIAITGEKFLDLNKKEFKEKKTFVIRGVSRNNDLSSPVSYSH